VLAAVFNCSFQVLCKYFKWTELEIVGDNDPTKSLNSTCSGEAVVEHDSLSVSMSVLSSCAGWYL